MCRRVIRWFRLTRLLDAATAADLLAWENSGFSVNAFRPDRSLAEWAELGQVHDDRNVFQASPDELPAIDIRGL